MKLPEIVKLHLRKLTIPIHMVNVVIAILLRKWTTPIHFLFGFLCAALIPYYPIASIALLAGFAFDQRWEYKSNPDLGSETDWWEGGVAAFAIGMGIVLILTWLKVYPLH